MNSGTAGDAGAARRRRRLVTAIRDSLRELNSQLSVLNHHVGARLELRDVDLGCLELLARHGPLSPGALARHAGLHPATMTGIVDRLERAGWVARERDPADRRAELFRLYGGMNRSLDEICAGYTDEQLMLLADFLSRTTTAGRAATEDLSAG